MHFFYISRLEKYPNLKRIMTIMRLTTFILIVFSLSISATIYPQSTKLSLDVRNKSIKEVLFQIENSSEFRFIYESGKINLNKKVSVRIHEQTVESVLNRLFDGEGIKYEITENNLILITPQTAPSSSQELMQQKKNITGIIVDESGEPVIGANVAERGTTNGTISDIEGKFSLSVFDNAVLHVSYIGYVSQNVTVKSTPSMRIVLVEDARNLNEVVVIGYGVSSVKDVTGSVTSVSSRDFNKGIISSPEQLIQGKAAGVQITSSSGEPGGGININIRGSSSVRSGNYPLYVVDGVPLSGDNVSSGGSFGSTKNPLNFLNPDDIKDIVILKDASATAIYGSRGANGVVIITTKSGQADQRIDYSVTLGVSRVSKKYDVLNAAEFLDALRSYDYDVNSVEINGGHDTDWQDQIYRTAISHTHNLSFGNSNDKGDYRVSISHMNQQGVIKNSKMQRSTIRLNGSRKYFDNRLKFETQLTVSDIDDYGVPIGKSTHDGNLLSAAIYMNPTHAVYLSDGKYNQPSETELNPVAMLEYTYDKTNTLRALLSFSAELEITKGLTFKTIYGYDVSKSDREDAHSPLLNARGFVNVGKAHINTVSRKNDVWENYINYNKTFDKLDFSAMLGYSYQSFDRKTTSLSGSKFRFDDVKLMLNNFASAETQVANSDKERDELQSYFGRVNLGFLDRFLLTATMRADGSTKFGENNKYGYFPSVAFAYRMSEEDFIPEAVSNLKFRLGWGSTGNQEIPHNLYTQRQRYSGHSLGNTGNITLGSLSNVTFANPDLKWETTKQYNFGIDFGFLNQRFSGTIDLYYKSTSDLLLQLTSAQPAPQTFYWSNLDADVINKGIEVSLTADIIQGQKFNWTAAGNFSYNKNEVKNLATTVETGELHGQGLTNVFIQRITSGQPMHTFYLRKFMGFDEDGISVYDGDYPQYVNASPMPKYTVGLTNNFSYKNFSLNVFFTGQFGHKIYNNTDNAFFYASVLANGKNVTKNAIGTGESLLNTADPSTRFLHNGSYVRLQDATLEYRVPLQKNKIVSSLSFFVTGQNLFVITGYKGQDPEVNIDKAVNGVPSMGIDYIAYPRSRTVMTGARIRF